MKKTLSVLFFLFASITHAQENLEKKDSIFVVFDYKIDPSLGMSRSYYPEGKEIFSAWNKRGDSLIFIGKENIEMRQSFFKDKKAKIFYVSKLIAVDIFYALKPIENKIIFMIDGNLLSKKVKLIKIDETTLSERPQE